MKMLRLVEFFVVSTILMSSASSSSVEVFPGFHESLTDRLEVNSRIVNGIGASENQFPFFGLAILYRIGSSTSCGSSLISSSWVLTAAHCMANVTSARIFLGSVDRQNMQISRTASMFKVHEFFDMPTPLANYVALIKLSSPVAFSDSVQAIQLPRLTDREQVFASTFLTAAGFGQTLKGKPRYLQFTHLMGMSNTECRAAHWVFRESMICAKSAFANGSGVCYGDSGGPLISTIRGFPVLVGVSSFVQTAACVNDVQGFARVDRFLDWINEHTGIPLSN